MPFITKVLPNYPKLAPLWNRTKKTEHLFVFCALRLCERCRCTSDLNVQVEFGGKVEYWNKKEEVKDDEEEEEEDKVREQGRETEREN